MATGNNIDLVPAEVLEQVRQLDNNLKETIKTSGSFLTTASQINKILSNQASSYKDVVAAVAEYNKMEVELIAIQQRQQEIIKKKNQLQEEVIRKNSQEVETSVKLRNAIEETNSTRQQEITLQELSRKAYDEVAKSIENERKQLITLQVETNRIKASIKDLEKEYKQRLITEEQYISRKATLVERLSDQQRAEKTLSDQIKYGQQIINTTIGSYNNLSAQYSRLKIVINDLSEAEKYNGYTKKELEAQAKALYEEMNRLQKETGKHQLQVGQYDLAVKDLTKTISILDPRIGAIINKAKNISQVKQVWTKVNDQLVKSLNISSTAATLLQGALVALVVGGVYLAYQAFQKYRKEKELLNEINKSAAESARSELTELNILYSAVTNTSKSYQERVKYVEMLQSKYPDYLRNVEKDKILNGELVEVFDKLRESIVNAARARAVMEQVATIEGKIIEQELKRNAVQEKINESFNRAAENVSQYQKALLDQVNGHDKNIRKLEEEKQKYIDLINVTDLYFNKQNDYQQKLNDVYSLSALRLKNEIDLSREVISNTANEYGVRLSALNNYEKLQIQSVKLNAQNQLNELGITAEKRKLIEAQTEAEISKIMRDAYKERRRLQQDYNNFVYERINFVLNREKQVQSEIISDNSKKYQERNQALNSFYELQAQSIQLAGENQLKQIGLSESQKALIVEKTNAELKKLERERLKTSTDLLQVYVKEQSDSINEINNSRLNAISYSEADDMAMLAKQYKEGVVNKQEYEKQKTDLTVFYAKERLDAELRTLDELLSVSGLTEEQITEIKQKQRDTQLKYDLFINQQIVNADQKAAKQRENIEKSLVQRRKQLIQELGNFATQIISNVFQSQVNLLNSQLEEVQKFYDERNEIIDNQEKAGLITSEYAAVQRKYLNDEQARQEEELEQKKKEILLRQAKFEKAQAILSSGINTALAITRQLTVTPLPLGAPLIATIAAIGAAQLATILATPLPQYKYGTDNHPGGLAVVGDGGRHEMAVFPDGSIYKTPNTSTVVSMPAGTEVFPDFDKAALKVLPEINMKNDNKTIVVRDSKEQIALQRENNEIAKHILFNQKKIRTNTNYLFIRSDNSNAITNRFNN